MKKKFILIILYFIFFMPIVSYAGCMNCGIYGGGNGGSGHSSDPCNGDCGWVSPSSGRKLGGVRITLYAYDANTLKKLGAAFDILPKDFDNINYVTSQSVDSLGKRKNNGNQSGGKCGIYFLDESPLNRTIKWSDYIRSSNYIIDSEVYSKIANGTVGNWLYNIDDGSGKLKSILFEPMIKGDYETVANMFRTSKDEIVENLGNMYIVAELMIGTFYNNPSNGVYLMPVSEASINVIDPNYVDHLYISNYRAPIGKLVSKANGNGLIKATDQLKPVSYKLGVHITGGVATNLFCQQSYGLAIWYLKECCPECEKSCENDCSAYPNGSLERQVCAKSWCEANAEGSGKTVDECVSSCQKPTGTPGCGDNSGKCVYVDNATGILKDTEEVKENMTKSCKATGYGEEAEYTSRVCYDDSENYTVNGQTSGGYQVGGSATNIKYYRIDCTEKAKFGALPREKDLIFTTADTASLYLGYSLNYSKTCQLKWLADDNKNWLDTNTPLSSATRIASDIEKLQKQQTDAENKQKESNLSEEDKKFYKQMETYAKEQQTTLKKVPDFANQRLENYGKTDHVDETSELGSVTLQTGTNEETTETVDIHPVWCEAKVGSENDGDFDKPNACINDNPELSSCDDDTIIGKVSRTGTKTTYSKQIYYALESSYVEANTPNTRKIWHDEKYNEASGEYYSPGCNRVIGNNSGLCIRHKNVWQFGQEDNEIIGNTIEYTLLTDKMGSCGQFELNLQCDVVAKDITEVEEDITCEEYCGSDVACRAQYCPNECPECPPVDEEECDECGEYCKAEFTENSREYLTCENNCCNNDCGGNVACTKYCCEDYCKKLSQNFPEEEDYQQCLQRECICPTCNDDYEYRSINMNNPFPGENRKPGRNWYGLDKYITDSSNDQGPYYDPTDGRSDDFEYRIKLSSDNLKELKKNYNTTYTNFVYSDSVQSTIIPLPGEETYRAYCSSLLYDNDSLVSEKVEFGSTSRRRCE